MIEVLVDFDPLRITLPGERGPFTGEVRIVLPELHVKLVDLDRGMGLDGAHIGGDIRAGGVTLTIPDDRPLTVGELCQMIADGEEVFKSVHAEYQKALAGRFLLDGRKP